MPCKKLSIYIRPELDKDWIYPLSSLQMGTQSWTDQVD